MVLFAALMPIVALYLVWLPLTAHNYIKAADIPENKHITPIIDFNSSHHSDRKKEDSVDL